MRLVEAGRDLDSRPPEPVLDALRTVTAHGGGAYRRRFSQLGYSSTSMSVFSS